MAILAKKTLRGSDDDIPGILQCLLVACELERWHRGHDRNARDRLWQWHNWLCKAMQMIHFKGGAIKLNFSLIFRNNTLHGLPPNKD